MKRWKKILLGILIFIIVLSGITAVGAYGVFHHYYNMLDVENIADASDTDAEPYTGEEDETDFAEGEDDDSLSDEEVENLENEMNENLAALEEYINGGVEETDAEDTDTDSGTKDSSGSAKTSTTGNTDTSNLYNLLVIGVDSRSDNFSGRSDMIMVITINKSSKKIVVTSILRDTYVTISGYKSNRINASYAFGGASLLISTIKQNLGIVIDDYVIVNFYTVVDFIDFIGGVDIDVTSAEIEYINSNSKYQAGVMGLKNPEALDVDSPGVTHLTGIQTLAYGRIRYIGTDFARVGRQQTVALAALNIVKKCSLSELNSIAEEFLPRIRTSLSESKCLDLITTLLSIGSYDIDTMTIPQSGTWSNATIRKMAVLTIDFTANYKAWLKAVQ